MRRPPRVALPALLAGLAAGPAEAGLLGSAYLDAGYQFQVQKETDLEGQGYSAGASIDIGNYFFASAGYSSVRTARFTTVDDNTGRLEYRSYGGSLGGFLPLAEQVGLAATAGYGLSQTLGLDGLGDAPVERADGAIGSLSLNLAIVRWVGVSVGTSYAFVDGQRSLDGSAGLSLQAFRNLWIDSSYWVAEGSEGWSAGLRARLGE